MEEKMKKLMALLDDENNKTIKPSYTTWNGEEYDGDDDWDDDEGGNYVAEFTEHAEYKEESVRDEIDEICCDLFIANGGRPNWVNIKTFEKMSGYEVGPGESDSFGWLTGVVSKGDVMYVCFG